MFINEMSWIFFHVISLTVIFYFCDYLNLVLLVFETLAFFLLFLPFK